MQFAICMTKVGGWKKVPIDSDYVKYVMPSFEKLMRGVDGGEANITRAEVQTVHGYNIRLTGKNANGKFSSTFYASPSEKKVMIGELMQKKLTHDQGTSFIKPEKIEMDAQQLKELIQSRVDLIINIDHIISAKKETTDESDKYTLLVQDVSGPVYKITYTENDGNRMMGRADLVE